MIDEFDDIFFVLIRCTTFEAIDGFWLGEAGRGWARLGELDAAQVGFRWVQVGFRWVQVGSGGIQVGSGGLRWDSGTIPS